MGNSRLKLDHLTIDQHEEAARLLRQVQDNLKELQRIVLRAPFADATARCQKRIQETLIDPLKEALERQTEALMFDRTRAVEVDARRRLYPSVYYAISLGR
jgi:uncharacterized lipoprotein YehR (DUF1307 family)